MDIIGELHQASIIFKQDALGEVGHVYRETAMWGF
jgi:hypothetical protein